MEIKVIKQDREGNLTSENITIQGEKEYTPPAEFVEFKGKLVNREEKEIPMKDGKKLRQFIYNDEADDRGAQLMLETFSPTDDGILAKLMDDNHDIHLYYEKVKNDYGVKFKIKAIQLPDGTWSVPKAKEAWKKGNMVNNRALAMQAAAGLFQGAGMLEAKDQEPVTEAVIAVAEKLYDWIKQA